MCVFHRTEDNKFELEEAISMQLRSKITVVRNIRSRHHSLLNASVKCSCSRFRGCGRNGKLKNNIQTTGKAIQLPLHGIQFLSEHLDLLEHRATTSASKGEKNFALPSFLVVCRCIFLVLV